MMIRFVSALCLAFFALLFFQGCTISLPAAPRMQISQTEHEGSTKASEKKHECINVYGICPACFQGSINELNRNLRELNRVLQEEGE